jgi:hypothetical protein
MSDPIEGLTKEQTQEYNKYKKMEAFFGTTDNTTIIATYVPMETEVGEFGDNVEDVEETLPAKVADNKGITDEKDLRKEKVAEYWYSNVLSKSKAYALKVKNTELSVKLSKTAAEIADMRDGDVQPFCTGVKTDLTPLLLIAEFIPYGVDEAALTLGMTKANDFKDYIGKTKGENAKKTVAGENIDLDFTKLRDNNVQFRLLNEHFKESYPDFYKGFIAIDVEDDIGIHHSGLEGVVTKKEDGSPIPDAVIKNVTKNKLTGCDLLGHYRLIKQMAGLAEIEVSAPGRKTIKLVVTIKRGKIVEMNFEMEAL